jgi:MFS family permease
MNNAGEEHSIQPQPDGCEPPALSGGRAESLSTQEFIQCPEQRQRTVVPGTIFGTFVGLLMGAAVGAACCWLTGQFYFFRPSVLIGALAGPIVGMLIGFTERKTRGALVRPDIATLVGIVFGLLPALLFFGGGVSSVHGRFSGLLFVGAVFAGPMIGLVVGGILDRAFEEYLKKSWGVALPFGVTGVAICIGLVCLFDALAYSPDPQEVARTTGGILISDWSKSPDRRNAVIHHLTLVRKDRMSYTGFVEVTFSGRPQRLLLEVVVDGDMLEVSWRSEPEEEHGD